MIDLSTHALIHSINANTNNNNICILIIETLNKIIEIVIQ